jgi:hypothetical protein
VNAIPIYDATAPIACTAGSEEISARIEQLMRMRAVLGGVERSPHGLLLYFPNRPDIDADLRTFVVDEKCCCSFWGFAIDTDDEELTLRWDGPPDVDDFFAQLVEFFEGDEPLTAIDGLL